MREIMPRNPLDIRTAVQRESFRIHLNSLSPILRKRFSRLTVAERLFYLAVGISAVLMAVGIVFVRTKNLEVQSATNEMRINMLSTQTQISQYKQSIQDLTSSGKVGQVATDNGLSRANSTVIKVTK